MSVDIKANDWRVSSMAQVGGTYGFGGGVNFFQFSSYQARAHNELIIFSAAAFGGKGSIGGASLRPDSFNRITCLRRFSIRDLHNSAGNIISGGASFGAGFSLGFISAGNTGGFLFINQSISGWVAGVSFGVNTQFGVWNSTRILL